MSESENTSISSENINTDQNIETNTEQNTDLNIDLSENMNLSEDENLANTILDSIISKISNDNNTVEYIKQNTIDFKLFVNDNASKEELNSGADYLIYAQIDAIDKITEKYIASKLYLEQNNKIPSPFNIAKNANMIISEDGILSTSVNGQEFAVPFGAVVNNAFFKEKSYNYTNNIGQNIQENDGYIENITKLISDKIKQVYDNFDKFSDDLKKNIQIKAMNIYEKINNGENKNLNDVYVLMSETINSVEKIGRDFINTKNKELKEGRELSNKEILRKSGYKLDNDDNIKPSKKNGTLIPIKFDDAIVISKFMEISDNYNTADIANNYFKIRNYDTDRTKILEEMAKKYQENRANLIVEGNARPNSREIMMKAGYDIDKNGNVRTEINGVATSIAMTDVQSKAINMIAQGSLFQETARAIFGRDQQQAGPTIGR